MARLLKPDGQFNQHPVREKEKEGRYNFLYHLQATSVLLTGGQFFQKKNVIEAAQEALQLVKESEFESHNALVSVFDEKSLTVWNSLVSVIFFKQRDNDRGIKYLDTVISCIEDKRVHPYISFITPDGANEKAKASTVTELGIILLSLLYAHKKTNDNSYLEHAKKVANQISSGALDYSGYDAWGLTFIADMCSQDFYLKRRDMMATAMTRMSTSSMTSLFAAIAQQALLACGKPDEELLKYQCELQVDPKNNFGLIEQYEGVFVRKKRFPEVRIDYLIQNLLSLMQYEQITGIESVI